jgi:hypothetical protein
MGKLVVAYRHPTDTGMSSSSAIKGSTLRWRGASRTLRASSSAR